MSLATAATAATTVVEALALETIAIKVLDANVIQATDMGTHAIEYAVRNWSVFPLRGKIPAIRGGRGVLDATTDLLTVIAWWSGRYAGLNIGGRVPDSMIVIDIDPRNGGLDTMIELQAKYGQLPETLTTISGRGDGGMHLFFRRPPGRLSAKRLGSGIDIKTNTGHTVLAPSIHPETGNPYTRIDRPVARPPSWLTELMRTEQRRTTARPFVRPVPRLSGRSIADEYCSRTSREDVLAPHNWSCLDADPDADGTRWRHPTATSPSSASIRHGCLFVYSTNTEFDITEPSNPHGYTKFRAFAVLNHGGDLGAAARYLRGESTK
ncbi:MAG: bifunctional DNA primase/polymerase [Mycobacterium sp.]